MLKTNNLIHDFKQRNRRMVLSCSKKLYTLLREITSKLHGDFIPWITFILLEQKANLNLMKKYVKIKDYCGIVMPSEKANISKFNQYVKSDKMSYIIYAGIESLTRKADRCANNSEKSSTTKIGEYMPCEYSVSTIWTHRKETYLISWKRMYEKVLYFFKRIHKKHNWFWKQMLPLT